MDDLYLDEMTGADDELAFYEATILPHMKPDDRVTPAEWIKMHATGLFHSWWIKSRQDTHIRGWCALKENSSYSPGAVHLYGGVVLPAYRGRGIGRWTWTARMALYPGRNVTVSIQPGTEISFKTAEKLGFVHISDRPPWHNYLLRRA